MKRIVCLFLFCALFIHASLAQVPSQNTMYWIQNQADSIESILVPAVKFGDKADLVVKLLHAYHLFDAVALVGVYCVDVRASASAGRHHTDLIHQFKSNMDVNSLLQRANDARKEANKMKSAAKACAMAPEARQEALPDQVIRMESRFARLDLEDALASEDFHILAQKLEHSMMLLNHVIEISETMFDCETVREHASAAIRAAERATSARNWVDAYIEVNDALIHVRALEKAHCKL